MLLADANGLCRLGQEATLTFEGFSEVGPVHRVVVCDCNTVGQPSMYEHAVSSGCACRLCEAVGMDDLSEEYGEDWSKTAARELRRLRKARKWSYADLAKQAGLPRSTISNVENGFDRITVRVLLAVARALETSTDELLGLGERQASLPRSEPTDEGGNVELKGIIGQLIVPIGVDLPELGLRRGDLLEVDPDQAAAPGKVVVVQEQGGARIYRVRSMAPLILDRAGAPSVVFDERYHTIAGTAVRLIREM